MKIVFSFFFVFFFFMYLKNIPKRTRNFPTNIHKIYITNRTSPSDISTQQMQGRNTYLFFFLIFVRDAANVGQICGKEVISRGSITVGIFFIVWEADLYKVLHQFSLMPYFVASKGIEKCLCSLQPTLVDLFRGLIGEENPNFGYK